MIRPFYFVSTAATVLLAACGGPPPAFTRLQTATIEPGAGMAGLALGDSLDRVTSEFGVDQVVGIAGDDYFVELRYPKVGLALLFAIVDDCRAAIDKSGGARALATDLREPADFFTSRPDCRSAPLESITVGPDGDGKAFFTGATSNGLRLGTTRDEVLNIDGLVAGVPGLMLAGDGPETDGFDRVVFLEGVAAYLGPVEDSEQWQVRRLAIFDPAVLDLDDDDESSDVDDVAEEESDEG
jgi:hypothetical protein